MLGTVRDTHSRPMMRILASEDKIIYAENATRNRPAFNPCCCDCDGKYDMFRCCRGMSIYGIIMYTFVFATCVGTIVNTKNLTAKEYLGDVDDAPEFVQDYQISFDGFRWTAKIFLIISSILLIGYTMLLAATLIKSRNYILCLGLPVATVLSVIIQVTLYFYFDGHKSGILINFFLLLDIYFSSCAVALFTSLRPGHFQVHESSIFDFPEYPEGQGERGKNEKPPAYLTRTILKYPWNHKNYNLPSKAEAQTGVESGSGPQPELRLSSENINRNFNKSGSENTTQVKGSDLPGNNNNFNVIKLEFEDVETSSSSSEETKSGIIKANLKSASNSSSLS